MSRSSCFGKSHYGRQADGEEQWGNARQSYDRDALQSSEPGFLGLSGGVVCHSKMGNTDHVRDKLLGNLRSCENRGLGKKIQRRMKRWGKGCCCTLAGYDNIGCDKDW